MLCGSLLDFFSKKGCKTLGIEPTGAVNEAAKRHTVIKGFFDAKTASRCLSSFGFADIITFTNVFAHIGDLKQLLDNVKSIMSQHTILIIENHYIGDILSRGQFDTFYHEHPRTYSFHSFLKIAESLEKNVIDVEFVSRYGGNVRVHIASHGNQGLHIEENNFVEKFNQMNHELESWKKCTRKMLLDHVSEFGPIAAKAFPGRAAILVKLLGLTEKHISAVYEIEGSVKTGHYVPGTRIPILEEDILYQKGTNETILNLAWHIPEEVRANLKSNNFHGEVIDIR